MEIGDGIMKIYFEDGIIDTRKIPIVPDYIVDAADGVSNNLNLLYSLSVESPKCIIYTNSILALENRYAWNDKRKTPDIFIRGECGAFRKITKFTGRELRRGHNLKKLYISGEFE